MKCAICGSKENVHYRCTNYICDKCIAEDVMSKEELYG